MLGLRDYRRPINMIAAVDVIAFALLYLYEKRFDKYIIITGAAIILITYLINFILVKGRFGDEYIFTIVAMLCSLGVIMLYRIDPSYGLKQIVWLAAGIALFFISYFIYSKINIWDRLIYFYPTASFALFILTLFFGRNIQGATNWIQVGGFSFQPSEFIKLLFIFFLASYYQYPERLDSLGKGTIKGKYIFMAIVYAHMGFLVLQGELGTALLLFLIFFAMLYVFEDSARYKLVNVALALAGGAMSFLFVHHVQVRVQIWLNPWADIAGKGYQITQSLFAIGAGGFFGTGLGLGRPDLIPAVHTDFIFSAICEEIGIFGGIAVVLLYFILVYRGAKITLGIKNLFPKSIALGLTAMFGFQTFIIVGGVIKLIPLTGITLPFISYGGSSLITSFMALGVLQAISKSYFEGEGGKLNAKG